MTGISVTEKRFLTVNDVKDYLGCTYYTAHKIMHYKDFPSFTLDDLSDNLKPRFLVELADFEEWLKNMKKNKVRNVRNWDVAVFYYVLFLSIILLMGFFEKITDKKERKKNENSGQVVDDYGRRGKGDSRNYKEGYSKRQSYIA